MAITTTLTYGPVNIDSLLASTRSVFLKTKEFFNDAIFNHIPLLRYLNTHARIKQQGGASVLVPIIYAKNGSFKAYNKDDVLDTTGVEGLTLAQAKWASYGGTITYFGDEVRTNMGEGKMTDLIKAKTMQAVMSGRDALELDMWLTAANSKKIQPLDVLVDTTSSVQDINSTTNSWWQAQSIASGSFAARGPADMRNLRDTIIKQGQMGAPTPDQIITTQLIYELYEQSLTPSIRYGSREEGDGSFSSLKFSTMNIDFDTNAISGNLYMLSSEALQLVVHSAAEWSLGEFRESIDQDMWSAKVIWMGQLAVLNRRRLGKLTGITA